MDNPSIYERIMAMSLELLKEKERVEEKFGEILKVEKDKKENIKVLLVDDEEEFVRTLSERIQLRDIGSKVMLDGEKAVKSLEEEIPDVVVLDLKCRE